MKVIYDDCAYLEHHGVKGMIWGQRREKNRASVNQALKGKDLILTKQEARKIRKGTMSLKKVQSKRWQQSHVRNKGYDRTRAYIDSAVQNTKFAQQVNKRIGKGQDYAKAYRHTAISTFAQSTALLGGLGLIMGSDKIANAVVKRTIR